VVFGAKKASLG